MVIGTFFMFIHRIFPVDSGLGFSVNKKNVAGERGDFRIGIHQPAFAAMQ